MFGLFESETEADKNIEIWDKCYAEMAKQDMEELKCRINKLEEINSLLLAHLGMTVQEGIQLKKSNTN